jgi:hypothetical protein
VETASVVRAAHQSRSPAAAAPIASAMNRHACVIRAAPVQRSDAAHASAAAPRLTTDGTRSAAVVRSSPLPRPAASAAAYATAIAEIATAPRVAGSIRRSRRGSPSRSDGSRRVRRVVSPPGAGACDRRRMVVAILSLLPGRCGTRAPVMDDRVVRPRAVFCTNNRARGDRQE